MISEKMKALTAGSSLIRAMFKEGKKMAAKYGKEKSFRKTQNYRFNSRIHKQELSDSSKP